jgi:hypothetical protein
MTIGRTHVVAIATLTVAIAVLAGCGTPGAPQPPSLNLPKPVDDLRATRQGDKVMLTWMPPRQTTDKQRIRRPGITRICRALTAEPPPAVTPGITSVVAPECKQVIAEVQPTVGTENTTPDKKPEATFADVLRPELEQPLGSAVYSVEVLNPQGRSAGPSNAAAVPLAPTLPPPDKLLAHVTAEGPVISWVVPSDERSKTLLLPKSMKQYLPVDYNYRLYRQEKDKPNLKPAIVPIESAFASPNLAQPNINVIDAGAEWEKTYLYSVVVLTTITANGKTWEIEGAESQPVEVFAHDIFPPTVPTGVQAVFTALGDQRFIDLTWLPSTARDLAGYNVYRREQGGAPVKVNADLVKAPAFRDTNVSPGHTYWYSASAVDQRGNESARSAEARETVPAQP